MKALIENAKSPQNRRSGSGTSPKASDRINPQWLKKTAVCVAVFLIALQATASPFAEMTLLEGADIALELNDHLSTKVNKVGDPFTAKVLADVFEGDQIVIPKDSVVTGSVSRVVRPGRFRGRALMNLLFDSIRIPGKGEFPVVASLVELKTENESKVKAEGTIEARGTKRRDVGKVAKPGAVGAGIGALVGGGKGAAISGGIGAAIGLATVFATRGRDIEIRRGSVLEIVLERSLVIEDYPITEHPEDIPQ